MKILTIDKIRDSSQFLLFFILLLLGVLFTSLSPNLFHSLEPDSQGYIDNDPIRTFLYPIIIDVLYNESDSSFKVLFFFQNFLLITSILSLIFSLKPGRYNNYFASLLFFFILSNFYYTSFSDTVLTESLFFSFINFSASLLLHKNFLFNYKFFPIVFGLLLGGIVYIKSIGIVISILFFFIFIYKSINYKNFYSVFFFFIGLFFMLLIEKKFNTDNQDNESSVLSRSLSGKIFMLCGNKNFDLSLFKPEFSEYILLFLNESKKINNYLDKLNNPFLIANLKSDYETVGQYKYDEKLSHFFEKYDDDYIENLKVQITSKIIKNYPKEYLKLSLWHYLGLWSPGGKHIFLDYNDEIPFPKLLEKSSGKILEIQKEKLLIGFLFFIISLCFFTFFTIRGIYIFLKDPLDGDHTFTFMLITCQIYFITVCLTNVSTPRYLMPFFPLITIFICIYIKDLFNYLNKKKHDVKIK